VAATFASSASTPANDMRVLVTGGTGYVGAHTVQALLAAGHTPRLLVRNTARLATTVGALGVDLDALEIAPGDMTDKATVATAVAGVAAVIHSAAVVAALNRSDAKATVKTNVNGTKNVIDAALAAGCDPVVHVSSVAALFTPAAPLITADLAPATHADSPYTRSKALAEQFARQRQSEGAPVTIVYPGGVSGPAAGEAFGDVAEGMISMLKPGLVPLKDGAVGVIDVRDLALVLVATLTPGLGPRRFIAGGDLVDMQEVGRLMRELTGRKMPVLPLPGLLFRGLGRAIDLIRKVVPFDTVYTAEAMDLLTHARPTDDSAVHQQLGVDYRPTSETFGAMIRALYDAGRLSAKDVGTIAT
jgi:dihydroflavonol-4-reductase